MSFAILRVQKLDMAAAKAASGHMSRARPTPNADPARAGQNRVLLGSGDPFADVQRRIQDTGVRVCTSGQNRSVVALDVFLGASPEWFAQATAEQREAWCDASVQWLQGHFGADNVASVVLHADETTPHLTAMIVPVDDSLTKSGTASTRLNAKRWLDGKAKMSRMQDAYAVAVAEFGLARGVRGSKAQHETVASYYGRLNAALEDAQGVTLKSPVLPEPPGSLSTPGQRREYHVDVQQRMDYAVSKANEYMAQAAELVAAASVKTEAVERRVKAMERTAHAAAAETAALRDIPLEHVAKATGLEPRPSKGTGMWSSGIAITGSKWYDHRNQVGGGGAIDLAKHLRQSDFRDAKAWLRDTFGVDAAAAATVAKAQAEAKAEVADAVRTPYISPARDAAGIESVRKWLYRRGIDPSMFDLQIARGTIYASRMGSHVNAVFTRQDGARGAEIHGTGQTPFKGLAPRSDPAGSTVFSVRTGAGEPDRVVVVESGVKALAYAQMHADERALVVSTTGARSRLPWLKVQRERGRRIIVAYDADKPGDEAAEALIREHGGERRRPEGAKDWDDLLPKPRPGPSEEREGETLEQQNARFRKEWAEIEERKRLQDEARDLLNRVRASEEESRGPTPG